METHKQPFAEVIKFVEKDFLVGKNDSLIPSADLDSLEEFRQYPGGSQ